MRQLSLLERIPNVRPCPAYPERLGTRSTAYPWAAMEPGHVFLVDDPSPQARSRLSAAATQAGKRLGVWFATGPDIVDGVRVGWWCVRYDGVELMPQNPTLDQQRGEASELRRYNLRRKRATTMFRKQRIEPPSRIGDYAIDAQGPVDHVPADEADQWMRPREAGEVF